MADLIECCISNEHRNLPAEVPDCISVREDACLQRCGVCYDASFAVVDGELVEADSPSKLFSDIQKVIEE